MMKRSLQEQTNTIQMTLQEYKHLEVSYSVDETQFGKCLIASTTKGICSILFADTAQNAEADLKSRFRYAAFTQQTLPLHSNARIALLDSSKMATLPFHVYGTPFQHKVWKELAKIPAGVTSTYGAIANNLGDKKLSRAVGAAIGSNPIGYYVPCHRVISSTGKLTGFRWGIERKEKMLAYEKSSC